MNMNMNINIKNMNLFEIVLLGAIPQKEDWD